MANFIPFDPKKHKPVDAVSLGLPGAKPGQNATEFLASEKSPEGGGWNIPTIWFNEETGKPLILKILIEPGTRQSYMKKEPERSFRGSKQYRLP